MRARWLPAAPEIIAKPCHGGDLQAVGRLFRLELQDLSAGLGAQAILSATMGTFFTFLLPYHFLRWLTVRLRPGEFIFLQESKPYEVVGNLSSSRSPSRMKLS